MTILMYSHFKHSLDPIIYRYLKNHANVFLLSKDKGDILINNDDTIDTEELHEFIKKHKITHFFYSENSSYVPIFLNAIPQEVIKVMLLIDTHINVKRRLPYFSLFDLILLVNKQQVTKLRHHNPNTVWLTYGSDTNTFHKLPGVKKKYEVIFNGNIIPWIHYHRFFLLTYLKWRKLPVYYSTALYPEHNKLFNESKIILNRSPLGGWNLRIFEAMASGTLLITDRTENGIPEILKDKEHLVYYDSLSDLAEKIQYYLTHDTERERIAKQGYDYIRAHYSWDEQIKKMLAILRDWKVKPFKRKPYYLSLSDLECFSFRNKTLALRCLKQARNENEITLMQYYYYLGKYVAYLDLTDGLIKLLNFIRINFLVKPFVKK